MKQIIGMAILMFTLIGLETGCAAALESDESKYTVRIYDRETEETIERDCYSYEIYNEENELVKVTLYAGNWDETYERIGDLRVEVQKN